MELTLIVVVGAALAGFVQGLSGFGFGLTAMSLWAWTLEPQLAALLPELVWQPGPEQLAALAAKAQAPRSAPQVDLSHLHAPAVSVREQAAVLVDRLRRHSTATFRSLVQDAGSTLVVVARFLGLLELFRESAVAFEQVVPLGELTVRWTGTDEGEIAVGEDFDLPAGDEEPGQSAPEEGTA